MCFRKLGFSSSLSGAQSCLFASVTSSRGPFTGRPTTNISNFQRGTGRESYRGAACVSVWSWLFGKKSMMLLCLVVLVTEREMFVKFSHRRKFCARSQNVGGRTMEERQATAAPPTIVNISPVEVWKLFRLPWHQNPPLDKNQTLKFRDERCLSDEGLRDDDEAHEYSE